MKQQTLNYFVNVGPDLTAEIPKCKIDYVEDPKNLKLNLSL